jgi:hypothetical protein
LIATTRLTEKLSLETPHASFVDFRRHRGRSHWRNNLAPGAGAEFHGRAPQDAGLKAMLLKKNVYTKLYNETLSFESSWGRYASWVDLKRGPTGKKTLHRLRHLLRQYRQRSSRSRRAVAKIVDVKVTWPPLAQHVLAGSVAAFRSMAPKQQVFRGPALFDPAQEISNVERRTALALTCAHDRASFALTLG